jgi:hypothetical protein
MINPSICKRVRVIAEPVNGTTQYATLNGTRLEVNELRHGYLKPGNRYAYLKFSIMADSYYLTRKP